MSGNKLFVVEWSKDWGDVVAVHPWEDWSRIPVMERTFFCETIEARDELDAYIQAQQGANP